MNKFIHTASAGLLALLVSLIAIPARAQLPSSQPATNPTPTPSPQPTIEAPASGNIIAKFRCSIADTGEGEVLLRANGYYTFNSQNGKYQTIERGYRFLSGSLRGQSIFRSKKDFYPIPTISETKAAYLIANDSSLKSCNGTTR